VQICANGQIQRSEIESNIIEIFRDGYIHALDTGKGIG
jgi:hypothetical protein